MASYFDIAPRVSPTKTHAATAEEEGLGNNKSYDETYGKFGLLSPQVSRILDDLELDDQSSGSDDAEGDESDQEKNKRGLDAKHAKAQDKSQCNDVVVKKPTASTPSSSSKLRKALTPNENISDKTSPKTAEKSRRAPKGAKQPNFTRFQSLRTMLFNSHIEENLAKRKKEEAEQRWKKEFQSRKGLERQKTQQNESGAGAPEDRMEEKEKDGSKERGVMKRMGSKLKRLGSKDVPTMSTVTEGEVVQDKHVQPNKAVDDRQGTGNENTASSEEEADDRRESEEINHSDVEELVRWISRRDPPSDGEARHRRSDPQNDAGNSEHADKSSDQESLGHSDVEDLVRWVSRRKSTNMPPDAEIESHANGEEEGVIGTFYDREGRASYSDADTESDSEAEAQNKGRKATMNDDDVDELVRWVSRQEGPATGPLRSDSLNSRSKAVKPLDSGTGVSAAASEHGD